MLGLKLLEWKVQGVVISQSTELENDRCTTSQCNFEDLNFLFKHLERLDLSISARAEFCAFPTYESIPIIVAEHNFAYP